VTFDKPEAGASRETGGLTIKVDSLLNATVSLRVSGPAERVKSLDPTRFVVEAKHGDAVAEYVAHSVTLDGASAVVRLSVNRWKSGRGTTATPDAITIRVITEVEDRPFEFELKDLKIP
jgi:hypothetical protein